jgi:hypothetical protein
MPLPIPWQQTANTNPGSNPIKESLFTVYDVWDHFRVRPVDRGRGGRWAASLVQSSLVWSGENPRLGLVPPPPIPASSLLPNPSSLLFLPSGRAAASWQWAPMVTASRAGIGGQGGGEQGRIRRAHDQHADGRWAVIILHQLWPTSPSCCGHHDVVRLRAKEHHDPMAGISSGLGSFSCDQIII